MGRTSPVVAQFEFAARVRKRREELGLPAAAVSKHLGFTRNFYSAVENSRSLLATAKLPLLIEVLEFDDTDAQTLATLLEQARTPGWWQPYAPVLDEAVVQFIGLEFGAVAIVSCENLMFHGLLQCENYANSVMSASPNMSLVDRRRLLELRLRRQEELFANDPPSMTFLFGETLLWQQYGGVGVLREQLLHVIELTSRLGPRIELRLRPFDTTPGGLQSVSTMVILDFGSPVVPSVIYRDAGEPLGPTWETGLVDKMRVNVEQALASSCNHPESLERIRSRADELAG